MTLFVSPTGPPSNAFADGDEWVLTGRQKLRFASGVWTDVGLASGPVVLTPGANVALDATLGDVFTLTPGQDETITTTGGVCQQRLTVKITTSGTSSWTLTFGTGFKAAGTLATGTSSAKVFTITFVSDGTTFVETGRTAAM